jgi:hypothetical protein
MFNKTYHSRAVQQARAVRGAGGGHRIAEEALERLPWAGIFEPWRSHVLLAAAAQKRHGSTANRRQIEQRRHTAQLELFPLLDLFPDA